MALSDRLRAILQLTKCYDTLADIGTDHAYLPIEAVRNGLCRRAIACDINKGPLEVATANIRAAGFADQIETRLGNGLAPLNEDEADCIVISGMGGLRIWSILQADEKKARFAKQLILQPQHDLEELRRNLHAAGYDITDEQLVVESASRIYVILLATYIGGAITAWMDEEYFLGKFLLQRGGVELYLRYQREKIGRYIQSISDCNARAIAEKRLEWIANAENNALDYQRNAAVGTGGLGRKF